MNCCRFEFLCSFPDSGLSTGIEKIGTDFGDREVSLESVVQAGLRDGATEIVVVTHEVQEGNFRNALKEIEEMEEIEKVASVLRVL